MNLLALLADTPVAVDTVKVEIAKDQVLEFRRPKEGETEEYTLEARREAEEAYYGEKVVIPQAVKEWLPAKRGSFIKATVLSRFFCGDDDYRTARKLFCKIARTRPINFDHIYNTWAFESSKAEAIAFAKELDDAKND